MSVLNREEILETLRSHKSELEAMGAVSLALFGSVARGDDSETSDVDITVEFSEDAQADSWNYFGIRQTLQERLSALLDAPVDLSDISMQKEHIREISAKESIYAF